MKRLIAVFFLLSVSASAAGAQDMDKGLKAYEKGDHAEAMAQILPLAEQGNVEAQFYIGELYDEDQNSAHDDIAAAKWFKTAADQGLADAQTILGYAHKNGDGVPQDIVLAYMWFNLATGAQKWLNATPDKRRNAILKHARVMRDRIAGDMTQAEIKEAQRRSREWLDAHPR